MGRVRTAAHLASVTALVTALLAACGEPPLAPPLPKITATPESLCFGDDFQTPVTLSAEDSTDGLSLLPTAIPDAGAFEYEWTLSGAAHRVVSDERNGPELQVLVSGVQPLQVELRLRLLETGSEAVTRKTISLTIDEEPAADYVCREDVDCGGCRKCDTGERRCLPPGVDGVDP
jgi:hypothetical protein